MGDRGTKHADVQSLLAVFAKFDPEVLTGQVLEAGEDWADKNGAANALEESRKSVLAKFFLEHAAGKTDSVDGRPARPISSALAEQKALADERYRAHLDMMVDARRDADRARVRYEMGKMKLELMRSLQATLRQELYTNNR